MGDTYDQDKRLIRGRLQASRSQLSAGEVARLSARACARLLASPIFARARHLAAYAAADNELDPARLIEAALAAGKNVYLPVTSRERFEFVTVPAARPGAEAGLPPGGPCLPPEVEDPSYARLDFNDIAILNLAVTTLGSLDPLELYRVANDVVRLIQDRRKDTSCEYTDRIEVGLVTESERVRRAVEKLDPVDREVLMLREFEQLSYAEIADLLQLPLNTVRSRLFRARTALRNLLEPPAESRTHGALRQITKKGENA